jgi:uncharacterized protein (UPF0276 family)
MPANAYNGFTDFGVGIGLRVPHYQHILSEKPVVDWFEIISENYMIDGGRPLHILDQILERYRVVQHGVSMYFGSPEPPNREHLRRLKTLVRRTKTPWLTDHLCWGSVDGTYTHDLLPMPYTFEAVRHTANKIREVRDFLEIPNFNPFDYVNGVPAERVAQIHIAGHSKFEKYILDTHDHPVIDPVWRLYERAIERAGRTATLLEWDDKIPSFKEVHDEALKANQFIAETAAAL